MRSFREEKGFTLIELAIVIVIIGILLGLVLRGSDLIQGAKNKKIRAIPGKWEVPIWTYYDREGVFPGDTTGDGLIDTPANVPTDLDTDSIAHPPASPASIEGVITEIESVALVCGSAVTRNAMLIGGGVAPAVATLDVKVAKRIDEDIDGTVDGQKGRVRYCGIDGKTIEAAWPPSGNVTATYLFDKIP
ncbi:hypothetical protein BMS3Bbin05_00670 [bacterium BMS3Bbin05]|nr:hypothetical protein BMS3Bbin05_00670 [bacterium BMS3Bbin05]HDL21121.1 prepilin-type N-terminal cleavage/methylation domain-containing protein [Nitrospirota bacterium]